MSHNSSWQQGERQQGAGRARTAITYLALQSTRHRFAHSFLSEYTLFPATCTQLKAHAQSNRRRICFIQELRGEYSNANRS